MSTRIVQHIAASPISCNGRKVDSLSFDGGIVPEDGTCKSEGDFNVKNAIVSSYTDDDGTNHRQLKVEIELLPKVEGRFYRATISVSGIYSASQELDDRSFDRAALTFGVHDLYAYAKRIIEEIAAGGVWGPLYLPEVEFSI